MCTVTYLPTQSGYIFTSNRDESPQRTAPHLRFRQVGKHRLLYPEDPKARGSWISVSDDGRLACLLNGAFLKHRRQLPYRRSRGLMLLDLFAFEDFKAFAKYYTFKNMEPFTLIGIEGSELHEFRWDGQKLHLRELPADASHIWSSTTLYPTEIAGKRRAWFDHWWQTHKANWENAFLFHLTAGCGDPHNDIVMNRGDIVRTVSISSIQKTNGQFAFRHYDLLSNPQPSFEDSLVEELECRL